MVTALQHVTWMDEEGFKKTCIREKKTRGDIHQPFYGTWVADFMLREDAERFMIVKVSATAHTVKVNTRCGPPVTLRRRCVPPAHHSKDSEIECGSSAPTEWTVKSR